MAEAKIRIRATDETAPAFGSAQQRLNELATGATAFAARFAGVAVAVAAVGAAFEGLKRVAEGIDALNDLADATGSSVEKLSALEDSTKRTGNSFESMQATLLKMNQALNDAKPGSQAEAAFKALGLSVQELKRLDPADALIQVARSFSSFENDGNKARIAQELFGRSLKEVAPLLADLAEKGLGNVRVTKEQAEAAEQFNRQLAELKKNSEDTARSIASALIPVLNKLFERGNKEGFLKALFTPDQAGQLARQAEDLSARIQRTTEMLEVATQRATGEGPLAEQWKERITALREQLQQLQREAGKTSDSLRKATGGPAASIAEDPRAALRKLEAASATKAKAGSIGDPELAKRFDAFVKKLEDATRGTFELSEVEKTRFELATSQWAGLNEKQREYLLQLARIKDEVSGFQLPGANDDARDRLVALQRRVITPASDRDSRRVQDEAAENLIANVRELAAQSRQAQIEQLARQMASVRDQMASGALSAVEYRRALDVLNEQMVKLEDNAGKVTDKMADQLTELEAAIGDTIGSSFLASMEGNLKRIDRLWGDMIRRMIAQASQADLQKRLFGNSGLISQAIGYFGGSSGGGGSGAQAPVADLSGLNGYALGKQSGGAAKAGTVNQIIVHGDVAPRTAKAMQATLAMWSAREQQRTRY